MKIYQVGGSVRDKLMGRESHDLDYAVECSSYQEMVDGIVKLGGTIYLEKPEFQTVRANLNGEAVDFVLCRKDGAYSDGRHPDTVEVGTIEDDLARRDFTMNAMATVWYDPQGKYTGDIIDPFGGQKDLQRRELVCVGSTDRLWEDPLRGLRAIRFGVTHEFSIAPSISQTLRDPEFQKALVETVSVERIREELAKMFAVSTHSALTWLDMLGLAELIFTKTPIRLQPTLAVNIR